MIFTSDVFHPLVSPLTTYTYSNQDPEAETVSASDQYRLPPGAFSLRHGFPECFTKAPTRQSALGSVIANTGMSPLSKAEFIPGIGLGVDANNEPPATSPHIAVILYYLRAAFTREDVLDSVSQEAAANPAAWHAWRTSRAKTDSRNNSVRSKSEAGLNTVENLRQQPGGARSPGEWNWDGVWEDRVRKSIQNSMSEQAMFKRPGLSEDSVSQCNVLFVHPLTSQIQFIDVDDETIGKAVPWTPHINQTPIFNTSDTP